MYTCVYIEKNMCVTCVMYLKIVQKQHVCVMCVICVMYGTGFHSDIFSGIEEDFGKKNLNFFYSEF